jgi:bacillithiol biosynthesis cysteine-adding enzyme BshC
MTMNKSFADLESINGFSSIFKAYVSGDEKLKRLYGQEPSSEGFRNLLHSKPFSDSNRELLADVIQQQYQRAGIVPGTKTAENINVLKQQNTYTVCTGHQLCLFTGPLYFIYKIITTINLAENLRKAHPDFNFVPVYWMASEDHDFEEINHIEIFGKKLVWEKELAVGSIASMPVGKIKTSSLEALLGELDQILGDSEQAKFLKTLLKEAYQKKGTLSEATRHFTNQLLGEFGLVILDPSDTRLKTAFASLMMSELEHTGNFEQVNKGIESLEKLGYPSQVNPREINLFYMKDELRSRIEFSEDRSIYHILNTEISFTKEQIKKELNDHPERFSPNVVLRPLYQQFIMPNIAYVGGPGEIAYWLEYKSMFQKNNIQFPILVPRNFVMWVDSVSWLRMEKFGLTVETLSRNLSDLEKDYMQNVRSDGSRLDEEAEHIQSVFASVILKAGAVDSTLKAPAEVELQKVQNGLKNIEAKMLKAEKQKQETALNQLNVLKKKLYPGDILQERVENFMPYYLKQGNHFIDILKENLDPFERRVIVFTEKD